MRLIPWFWRLGRALSMAVSRIRLKILVRQHGETPSGPVLLCAKHASGFDIPVLGTMCWRRRGDIPYFQMGSFVGYPILGKIAPMLRRLGAFSVLRPKEVLRLRRKRKWSRDQIKSRMQAVNEEAESTRAAVLRSNGALIVFPEGTRDDSQVRPLTSELEIRTASELHAEGLEVTIWPAVVSYGTPRFFRRSLIVDLLQPFPIEGRDANWVLGRITEDFENHWLRAAEVDEQMRALQGRSEPGRTT